jgi:hypothetical protein
MGRCREPRGAGTAISRLESPDFPADFPPEVPGPAIPPAVFADTAPPGSPAGQRRDRDFLVSIEEIYR